MLQYVPFIPTLVRVLSWVDVKFCQMVFFLETIMWFCLLFVYHIDLCELNIPVNLEWLLVVVYDLFFVIAFGFGLLIFCWEFLHLYSSKILACNFLLWWCLCVVLVSGRFHRMSLELLFNFLEAFEKDQCYFFFVCLVEFTCEAIWSWTFLYRKF